MIWAPQTFEKPPYAPETADGLADPRGSIPANCPTSRKGKSEPYARFCGSPPRRVGTGWRLMRLDISRRPSPLICGREPLAGSTAGPVRGCRRRSMTVTCCEGSAVRARAAPAAPGPDPMISAVGMSGSGGRRTGHPLHRPNRYPWRLKVGMVLAGHASSEDRARSTRPCPKRCDGRGVPSPARTGPSTRRESTEFPLFDPIGSTSTRSSWSILAW